LKFHDAHFPTAAQ